MAIGGELCMGSSCMQVVYVPGPGSFVQLFTSWMDRCSVLCMRLSLVDIWKIPNMNAAVHAVLDALNLMHVIHCYTSCIGCLYAFKCNSKCCLSSLKSYMAGGQATCWDHLSPKISACPLDPIEWADG